MIIKCCFLFLQDNRMYYYNIRYINIFVLKCICFIIIDVGVVRFSFFFVSSDHMTVLFTYVCTVYIILCI